MSLLGIMEPPHPHSQRLPLHNSIYTCDFCHMFDIIGVKDLTVGQRAWRLSRGPPRLRACPRLPIRNLVCAYGKGRVKSGDCFCNKL